MLQRAPKLSVRRIWRSRYAQGPSASTTEELKDGNLRFGEVSGATSDYRPQAAAASCDGGRKRG